MLPTSAAVYGTGQLFIAAGDRHATAGLRTFRAAQAGQGPISHYGFSRDRSPIHAPTPIAIRLGSQSRPNLNPVGADPLTFVAGEVQVRRLDRERRQAATAMIPAIGTANSRNSKLPSPPSGAKPKIRSMKSMSRPLRLSHNFGAAPPLKAPS